jgi:hypothetical protein
MFKLIKLAIYAFLGYALYELYQGIVSEARMSDRASRGARSSGPYVEENEEPRNLGRMSGGGKGREETTSEAGGTSVSHRVGRGATEF